MKKSPKRKLTSKIIRHDSPRASSESPVPNYLSSKQMAAIERHVDKHVGTQDQVWHEIMSDDVHLDILPVGATKKRPFQTFVTMGMSAVPMNVPRGDRGAKRLELCLVLPPGWPTEKKGLGAAGDRNWWPFRGLKTLGRLPSTYDTFLDVGHTVPNGDPPEPMARSCKFVCWLVLPPLLFKPTFMTLKAPGFTVKFLQIVPLYREEMDLKLQEGAEALLDRFGAAEIDPVRLCDPKRTNVGVSKRAKA